MNTLSKLLGHWRAKSEEEREEHLRKLNEQRVREKIEEFEEELRQEKEQGKGNLSPQP